MEIKTGINLSLGVVQAILNGVLSLALVPVYIKYLGVESYGLVGFFATLQVVAQVLDLGLSPTISRETSRAFQLKDFSWYFNLYKTLVVIYWLVGVVLACVMWLLSPMVGRKWLSSVSLSADVISSAVGLMGLVLACRWPAGFYQGVLQGAQRLAIASGINIACTLIGAAGSVFIVVFLAGSILDFFIWQAFIWIAQTFALRIACIRILPSSAKEYRFDLINLKEVWKFSLGMTGVALTGLILSQSDKVILSKFLDLEHYGYYMLATQVSNCLYLLLSPVFSIIFPRMTALVASGNLNRLKDYYSVGTRALLLVLVPLGLFVSYFSEELIYLWTKSLKISTVAGPIVSILVIGTVLNGVMHFPYALQLASGKVSLPLRINFVLICLAIPGVVFLTKQFGAIGGAVAWLSSNLVYLFWGTYLTHKQLLVGYGRRWLLKDVLSPVVVPILGIGGSVFLVTNFVQNPIWKLSFGFTAALISGLMGIAFNRDILRLVRNF